MDKPIKLFVLSDNRLFREALVRIFSKKTDIETIRSCEFDCEAVAELINSDTDVVLLDSAPIFCSELLPRPLADRHGRRIKVVMVAMKEDEDLFLQVVRHGAYGFVAKDASAIELVNAVRAVAEGEAICPPRLCKRLFDVVAQQLFDTDTHSARIGMGLTRREEQLVPLIDRGLTNKEIAAQLNLSEKTVKNHIHRILRKVGAEDRFGVAAACRLTAKDGRDSVVESLRPS